MTIKDQPPPKPNSSTPIWELVVADMVARDHVGRARYGTPLQAFNGRDALVDAYQEALDLCVYLRQAIEERQGLPLESGTVPEQSKVRCARCGFLIGKAGPCEEHSPFGKGEPHE